MKKITEACVVLAALLLAADALGMGAAPKEAVTDRSLPISEQMAFHVPANLKRCLVFSRMDFWKRVTEANSTGECEWIVLRPSTDIDQDRPLWIQFDAPLVIENKTPDARAHPLVISNETGRSIVFRKPKSGGCAVMLRKPNVAIMGFNMEGAICREAEPK